MVMAVAGSSSCGGGKEQPEQKPLTIKVDNDYFSLTEGDRVSYIKRNGSIPILNNIPSNESGTQVDVPEVFESGE